MDWRHGYITEPEYTRGYYRELCPGILRLACLSAGVAPPVGKPLRYLELGFGQGLSLNIHAAAAPGEFWGTDFNPTQVAHARALAAASGSGVTLLDDSFVEFASRDDLPDFDVIGLHGIWSWISDENRKIIINLIRRKLRIGGIVYIATTACRAGRHSCRCGI
jgi:predicted O-methyltransferase YrrM